MWSGDIVKADEEGFLYFVGRNDEMIKTSGYRVSPTEIEEVVYGTGLVARRGRARRRGPAARPAHRAGRQPGRTAQLDRDELLAELKPQLPLYMVPSDVVVRAELPRSPNNKFDRNLLRQELAA